MKDIENILLLVPYRKKQFDSWVLPPIGIGYLSTGLKKDNFHVDFLDCRRDRLGLEDIVRRLKESKPDVVGISVYTQDLLAAREISDAVKNLSSGIKIILGGPHLPCDPAGTMRFIASADFAFQGEAEKSFPALLRGLNSGQPDFRQIPNLIFREEDGGITVNRREFGDDLDSLGLPDWDLLLKVPYPNTPPTVICRNHNFAPILLTRGCPFGCRYCLAARVHGKKIRRRSLDSVFEEISLLYHKYGKREFHLMDDNFTADKQYVRKFCGRVVEEGYQISLASPNGVRLDTLDGETLEAMRKAGWYLLAVGIESGSDRVLATMNKHLLVDQIRGKIKLIRQFGIEVYGMFILGYPTETIEDIEATIRLARELDLVGAGFSNFHPFLGTEIYEDLVRRGEIPEFDYHKMESTYAEVVYAPGNIGIALLNKLHRKALVSFYARPRILLKIMSSITSLEHFRGLIKRGFSYFHQV